MKKGHKSLILILVIIAVVIIVVSLFLMINIRKCENLECFNSAMEKCEKVSYINDAPDAAWYYQILGKSEENCKIYVQVLQLKQGSITLKPLEGLDMTCSLPLGFVTSPKDNLAKCHGILKEEILTIIVNRNHDYILDNLNKIDKILENSTGV